MLPLSSSFEAGGLYLAIVVVDQGKGCRGPHGWQGHGQVSTDPAALIPSLWHEAMPEQGPPDSSCRFGHHAIDSPCVVPLPMLEDLHQQL